MKKIDSMNLWKDLELLPVGEPRFSFTATSLGANPLIKQLLNKDCGYLSEFSKEAAVKVEEFSKDQSVGEAISEKYNDYFSKLGGRIIYKDISNSGDTCIYLWKDSIVESEVSGSYLTLKAYSHNESFVRSIKEYFDTQWAPIERIGQVYAIIRQGMHLGLNSIGNAGIPLIKGNYTPKVIEDYNFVIRDLNSESPSGRITIMRGTAGTGKTHLIRAMLLEVPDAMFVLISPEIVTNLAGPELLPLLMNYRGNATGPIILILEDADKCLVARESTDMNSIQALLNLGDGILGSLLDMRIVATTNADEFKMDAAITRPGRLSKMLDVSALDLSTAKKVFERLLPNKAFPKSIVNNMTLAEVYSLARNYG